MSARRPLKPRLEAVASGPANEIRRAQGRAAAARVLGRLGPSLLIVPGLALLARVAGWLGGAPVLPPLWIVAALAAAVPLAALVVASVWARRRPVGVAQALIAVDQALDLDDRLATAHEFLDEGSPTPFHAAAIADAERHLARAEGVRLDLPRASLRPSRSLLLGAGLGLLMLALATIGIEKPAVPETLEAKAPDGGRVERPVERVEGTPSPDPEADAPLPEPSPRDAAPHASTRTRTPAAPTGGERPQDVLSRPASGASAAARSSTGSGASGGRPESAAPSKGEPKEAKQGTKPADPKPPSPRTKRPERAPEEDAGATAGQGRGRSSKGSPTASAWTSKDQTETEAPDDDAPDEEIEDEFDDSKARGGVQPHTRQRKPPVDRDLSIGFGSGKPPPDANGRGGPGGRKKQRGVAQLVLGIHHPDLVQGPANAGTTRVTQERVEPQAETAAPAPAEARRPREGLVGPVTRPRLLPWMQELIRTYFLHHPDSKTE